MGKQSKCDYCSGEGSLLNDTSEYSGIENVLLTGKNLNLIRTRYFPKDNSCHIATDVIHIKYCPMCGREL